MPRGEVRLLGCPGLSDPLAEVQTATSACLGGWAEGVAVAGARPWLQLESSWEEVWRLEAALETLLVAGQEPGLALRTEEVVAGLAVDCLHLRTAAWRRGRMLRPTRPGPWTSTCWTAAEC